MPFLKLYMIKIKYNRMKISTLFFSISIVILAFANTTYSQNCRDFHKSNQCHIENIEGFKLSSLSRSNYLEVGKTVTYEVVLYGNKEIIIGCCTEEKYYPIRFKLKSSVTGEVIYDNKYDKYIKSISLSLDRTELISIELTIVSTPENVSVLEGTKACVGLSIYMEKEDVRH